MLTIATLYPTVENTPTVDYIPHCWEYTHSRLYTALLRTAFNLARNFQLCSYHSRAASDQGQSGLCICGPLVSVDSYYICFFIFQLSPAPNLPLFSLTSNTSWYGVGIYFSGNNTNGSDTANVYYLNNFNNILRSYGEWGLWKCNLDFMDLWHHFRLSLSSSSDSVHSDGGQ